MKSLNKHTEKNRRVLGIPREAGQPEQPRIQQFQPQQTEKLPAPIKYLCYLLDLEEQTQFSRMHTIQQNQIVMFSKSKSILQNYRAPTCMIFKRFTNHRLPKKLKISETHIISDTRDCKVLCIFNSQSCQLPK